MNNFSFNSVSYISQLAGKTLFLMRIDDPGKLVFHAQEAVISIRIAVKVPDPPADDLLDPSKV